MMELRFNDDFKVTSLKRFDELRKEIVLQNAGVFNEKNINPYNCIEILVNLVYLINQGEKFTKQEKENLFFSVTKLFYSPDTELRQIIFLFLKHLEFFENSFILTGTLINEVNKPEQILKPNSFRQMGQIVDATSVAPIERLLKTAISSQNPDISSSAVLCTLYMCLKGFNIAKPWISEITDKLNSSVSQSNLLTFHTLLLIREIKDNDRLFLMKTYLHLSQSSSKSQFATCQLIRYIIEFIKRGEVEDSKTHSSFMTFLENCLFKNQQEAIILEASRGVLDLPTVKDSLLNSTFEILKNLLSNGKRVTKYATLKILNNVSNKYSSILSLQFFLELEKIIDDNSNNASLKAIALSIFLKISKGLSDYRLEKMFKTFHEQFATFKEEFKKEIVLISRAISRENSTKNRIYFNFFANLLRVEASLGVKMEITESLIWLIQNDSELKKSGILTLAEYIEDCSYDNIKTRILSVLGKEGPSVGSSSQLVRYIYNRIILENATVRAAAISSLGEIAYKEANLKKNIVNLIRNSLNDVDNEVRERAYFYVKALTEEEKSDKPSHTPSIRNYVFNPKNFDIDLLQNLLKAQKEQLLTSDNIALELSNTLKDPEKMSKILMSTQKEEKQKEGSKKDGSGIGSSSVTSGKSAMDKVKDKSGSGSEEHPAMEEYKKTVFYKIYGQPKLISNVSKLTDQYAEYSISYRKIIYENVLVLDYELMNTLEDNLLQNVTIELLDISPESGFDLSKSEIIEIEKLKYNEPKHLFFKLSKKEDEVYASCSFNILLKYDVQELDAKGNPHGNSYKDQYKIDKKVEICYADYFLQNKKVNLSNYEDMWKLSENSNFHSAEEKIQLPFNNMKIAGRNFSNIIGFEPLNDIEKVDSNAKKYEFVYSVVSVYESLVFVRLQVLFNQTNQCLARILIRSQDEAVSDLILNNVFKG